MTEKLSLLDAVRNRIRVKHYSSRTEKLYVQWIKSYIHFNSWQHPRELGAGHIETFFDPIQGDKGFIEMEINRKYL